MNAIKAVKSFMGDLKEHKGLRAVRKYAQESISYHDEVPLIWSTFDVTDVKVSEHKEKGGYTVVSRSEPW